MKIIATEALHDGHPPVSRHLVEFDDGRRRHWVSLDFPDGAAVVALTRERKVVLTRQHLVGGEPSHVLPGGVAHAGETFEETARRELREETGYAAGPLEYLFRYANLPAYARGVVHLYLALDVEPGPAEPAPLEVERVDLFDLEEAATMAARGAFLMSSTAMAVLAVQRILAERGLLR